MNLSKFVQKVRDRNQREELYSKPAYWDSKADQRQGYAVSLWENNCLNELYHLEQMERLEKALPDLQGLDVLDIGCGVGRIARWLADRGARVVGADFSDKTIAIAQRLSSPGNPVYRVESVFEFNDKDSFDIIISTGLLVIACRNRDQLSSALTRLRESLRPGGKLFLMEPVHRGFLHRVLDLDIGEFCDVLAQAGFTVDSVEQMHFWPARWLLAFIPWPKQVTTAGYRIGQAMMSLPLIGHMGDYKWVLAHRALVAQAL